MKIVRLVVCFIALIAFGVLALVIAHPYLLKMSARSHAEYDYNRLVSEAKTEVYVGYPELIERIVMDKRFAATITTVHLSGPNGKSMDFSSLRELRNLATVEISYCHGVDTIIATLNNMTGLKVANFYYCGAPEIILEEINNASLTVLSIHSFQPSPDANEQVSKTKKRLPNCTIRLTND